MSFFLILALLCLGQDAAVGFSLSSASHEPDIPESPFDWEEEIQLAPQEDPKTGGQMDLMDLVSSRLWDLGVWPMASMFYGAQEFI